MGSDKSQRELHEEGAEQLQADDAGNTQVNAVAQRIDPPSDVPDITAPESVDRLLTTAIQHGAGIDQMERLLSMRERLMQEQARKAYYTAKSKFQSELPEIKKTKKVYDKHGEHRYSYAPLDVIMAAIREPLERHGLSITVHTEQEETGEGKDSKASVSAKAIVYHHDGWYEESSFAVPVDKGAYMSEPQKWASALTYAKRYAICDALGITVADEDDDANIGFEAGVKYAEWIRALENENDLEALRATAKRSVDEMRSRADEDGRRVIMRYYEQRKHELNGGEE